MMSDMKRPVGERHVGERRAGERHVGGIPAHAGSPFPSDRRAAGREDATRHARLFWNHGGCMLLSVVLDQNAHGARIRFGDICAVPDGLARGFSRQCVLVNSRCPGCRGKRQLSTNDHCQLVSDDNVAVAPWTVGNRPGWTWLKSANTT